MADVEVSEEFFPFLQPPPIDHQIITDNPEVQADWDTGNDIIPDRIVQIVSVTAGDAHHMIFLQDIAEFVFETAVARVEMGVQLPGRVGANKKVDILVFEFVGKEMNPADVDAPQGYSDGAVPGNNDHVFRRPSAASGQTENHKQDAYH